MKSKQELLLFPFNGNARESVTAIFSINKVNPTWEIKGFLDDDERLIGKEYNGIRILGNSKAIKNWPTAILLALPGSPDSFLHREKIIESLGCPIERFATIIDTRAAISPDAKIGKNTLVMANAFVGPSATIGDHCIVLPNSVIAHDSRVGAYTVIGSNVTVSGGCEIDPNCYIGSGTRIKEGIRVGMKSLLGIGSCVIRNVPGYSVMVGNPARFLRKTVDTKKD